MKIHSLGYLAVQSTDLAKWRQFAVEIIGLMPGQRDDEDLLWLRMDDRVQRICVERGDQDCVIAAGWELRDDIDFEDALAELDAAGVTYERSPELAERRGVTDLITLADPSGNTLELYWGATVDGVRFASPAGVPGFVTGAQGTGHVVLACPNFAETDAFYRRILGFKLTDFANMGGAMGHFLHINERHHSLALVEAPHDAWFVRGGLIHLMVEVASITEVGLALDRATQGGHELFETLGQHENDRMTSFYVYSPAGFPVEFGAGAITVDVGHHVATNIPFPDIWGHTVLGVPE